MDEYIKREDVIHIFEAKADMATGTPKAVFHSVCKMIALLPAADVVEVRHGEWMPIVIQENYFDPPYCDTCKCSMCEYEIDVSETVYNYCPNCGAKMDGGCDGYDRP